MSEPAQSRESSQDSGQRLEFELRIGNRPRALSVVAAFIDDIPAHTTLGKAATSGLRQLVLARTTDAIEHAYLPGESGVIVIQSFQDEGSLILTIRDYGLPEDVARLEAGLHAPDAGLRRQIFGLDWAHVADELHWINYGPQGKALRITKMLHDTHITVHPQAGDLQPFAAAPPLAPEQDYAIRRMRPEDALQVSQLIYKAYGSTYFAPDVYYPERLAALNAKGKVLSFVALAAEGSVVGHYALECNQPGPVAEGGEAVVDPAHRGRHLLERMKAAAIDLARELGLAGVYADTVTVHLYTQKASIKDGAHLSCADLAISPRTQKFRGIAQAGEGERISCLLYFLWLAAPSPQTVFVPARHREAITKLYQNLGCPVVFGEESASEGVGELVVQLDTGSAGAFLTVLRIGQDSAASIRHAKRELIEHSHAEALYAELPLTQPGMPALAQHLEKEGFFFAGIAPRFSLGGDLFRMIYLTDGLPRDSVQTEEELGRWLVDYALADRARVSEPGGE